MVNATGGLLSTSPLNLLFSKSTTGGSVDSFAQDLVTAIEGYLGNAKTGSHFEIDVQSGQGKQFTVTVKDLSGGPTGSGTPAAGTVITPTTPVLTPTTPVLKSTTPLSSTPGLVIDKSKMTPTDAYWAEQPAAVQALRYTPDDQRYSDAQQLAKEGYTIDVPIMVWGWDPLVTMTLRQNDGYTWVPSAMQPNIPIGPGIANVWNLPGYDANNPPPGSIKVSTDFAQGTGLQDPWIKT
ncbi:MAG TPA: hypothetical protein VNX18_22575 [Bryobacteraceae bacterium]|nr:hypothetical protein [Bryobacteraceae bacterium]